MDVRRWAVAALWAAMTALPAAHAGEVTAVESVDLDRYIGTWYEIARLPNRFQKSCTSDVTAEYRFRDDGRIDVINRCRTESGKLKEASGVARLVDETRRSKLEVRFAPAFLSFISAVWGDYWILDLDAEYRYAVVGEPSRKYLWVLSREPRLEPSVYRGILERIEAQGYDPDELVETPQATQ